jgi:hypothetical protein
MGNMIYAVNYNIPDIFVYLIPNYLIAALYLGCGLEMIRAYLVKKKVSHFMYIFILIPAVLVSINYGKMKLFNSACHAKRAEEVLIRVRKDSLIISPDDFYSQIFWYYLIGENVGKKRNIYLLSHFHVNQVKAYLDNDKPIYLPEERKYIPPGLKVYCIGKEHCKIMQNEGYRMLKYSDNLYKVSTLR